MGKENYENSIVFLGLFVDLAGCITGLSLSMILYQLEVGEVIIMELI